MIKCMYQYYSLGNADGTVLISDLDQKDFTAQVQTQSLVRGEKITNIYLDVHQAQDSVSRS